MYALYTCFAGGLDVSHAKNMQNSRTDVFIAVF